MLMEISKDDLVPPQLNKATIQIIKNIKNISSTGKNGFDTYNPT